MGSERLGARVWEDSGQSPGAKGLGSSAWKYPGLFPISEISVSRACGEGVGDPTAAVARIHSLCQWALATVVLVARIWLVRVWGSGIR